MYVYIVYAIVIATFYTYVNIQAMLCFLIFINVAAV